MRERRAVDAALLGRLREARRARGRPPPGRDAWYGPGRSVIREPGGRGSPRRYLPVSQPPASGPNGVKPRPVLGAQREHVAPRRRDRAANTSSAPSRCGVSSHARRSRAPPRASRAVDVAGADRRRPCPRAPARRGRRRVSSAACRDRARGRGTCRRDRRRAARGCPRSGAGSARRESPRSLGSPSTEWKTFVLKRDRGAAGAAPRADPRLAPPAAVRVGRVEDSRCPSPTPRP